MRDFGLVQSNAQKQTNAKRGNAYGVSELVDRRRLIVADRVQLGNTQVTEPDIIDQYIKQVRRLANVLLPEFGEFLIDRFVVLGPLLRMLGWREILGAHVLY